MSESLRHLARYWALPDGGGRPVAYRGGNPLGREAFYLDVEAARRALAGLAPGEAGGRPSIVLFEPDAYRFAVWLLATWSLGLAAVLPGDDLPATREALATPWVGSGNASNALTAWSIAAAPDGSGIEIDHGRPGVTLFTSGSTGQPALFEKNLRQLRTDVGMLEAVFGGELTPDTRFVTSVPHQHMYGLPYFVLWSLTGAHPFVVEKLRYPEDLGQLPPADYVFISAPTFLKYLTDAPAARGVHWRMATSAGSPLAAEIAARVETYLQAPLFDIYGSTETGTIAHRRGGSLWQAFPGVRLSLEEGSSRLRIHSPWLADAEVESGFLSGDIARLGEHGMELLGRADRLVKIGGKRISLTQIEQELASLPEVARVRIVPLPGEREDGRVVLGAVIMLGPEGRLKYSAEKKARFDAELRKRLRHRLNPLALPRRWRYVEAFPCDEMGKETRQDLERLFAPLMPRARRLPDERGENEEDGAEAVLLQLQVPRDLVWFEGHFPGFPLLPGVVQLDWAAHFARLYFGFDAAAANVSGLKFQRMIRPGDAPRLRLVSKRGRREVAFAFTLGGKIYSHGVFASKDRATGGTAT
ncbi:MAG: AMP-binding protein [Azoarcus sp.]|jgi:3-hydroxymyristoyl/3-hydroxydecanoyl-(acyl carrier protein) dehydratase|nr:AMP-binding protein [Azoarcus sp.]